MKKIIIKNKKNKKKNRQKNTWDKKCKPLPYLTLNFHLKYNITLSKIMKL